MPGAPSTPEMVLREGVAKLGLSMNESVERRCLGFVTLLLKWARVHNLTAARDPLEVVTRHILDSLAIMPLLRGRRMVDIGSGAGFPGVPLALLCPQKDWTLIEARYKRVSFLEHAAARLQLESISVVHSRVQDYRPQEVSDTLVARAFAPLPEFVDSTRHLWHAGATVIAMKGKEPLEELKALPSDVRALADIVALEVPGLNVRRHAVVFNNLGTFAAG
ncbi:MAG: 16S rRNA (guanine(527)-N(7))-methyltransferase RsmG [Pseudomonadota bacterium]|nr:16S rRNA (guanine(527)-N(7))-methyltransferase RsmG [Pseudomonadota bacterium]